MKKFFNFMAIITICTFALTGQAITAVAAQGTGDITKTVTETPIEAPVDTIFSGGDTPPDDSKRKLIPWGPYKLFDDLYYIGTTGVGVFVLDTSDGLVLIDSGWGANDCGTMMADLQKLGLNPADIKMILLSHEHLDHYGCVKEWKRTVCPSAKVALSQIGWDYLRTRTTEVIYREPRPESVDIYLRDGQIIQLGDKKVEIFFTPGHSPGCVSFIFPVKDHGEEHVAGIMGGSGVPNTWDGAFLFYASVEYFKQKSIEAKCDVGLSVHATRYKDAFEKSMTRRPGEPHPLVLGTEGYITEYIGGYEKNARDTMDKLPKEKFVNRRPPQKNMAN